MTQNDAVLNYLKRGRSITPLVALDRFGIFRLAARIKELREAGYRIEATMVKVGAITRVASYTLLP